MDLRGRYTATQPSESPLIPLELFYTFHSSSSSSYFFPPLLSSFSSSDRTIPGCSYSAASSSSTSSSSCIPPPFSSPLLYSSNLNITAPPVSSLSGPVSTSLFKKSFPNPRHKISGQPLKSTYPAGRWLYYSMS